MAVLCCAFVYFSLILSFAVATQSVVRKERKESRSHQEVTKEQVLLGVSSQASHVFQTKAEREEKRIVQASASPSLVQLLEATPKVQAAAPYSPQASYSPQVSARQHVVTGCGHNLSGVSDNDVRDALSHFGSGRSAGTAPELKLLQKQRIFIAACLHQSEAVLPHWIAELTRLVLALRQKDPSGIVDNLFVSIYESGSYDGTGEYLDALRRRLLFLGVPHSIVEGNHVRGHRNRIGFLADVRNEALKPLVASQKAYDRVLWLNDIFFCADGALQMAFHALPTLQGGLGADAVCGMDYQLVGDTDHKSCSFYDIWVSHDMSGLNFNSRAPVTHTSEWWYAKNLPFQVFSCWNGMVVFAADVFQQQLVSFRRNHEQLGECAASEAELLARDMWKLGRGKFVVSPRGSSTYSSGSFRRCTRFAQPQTFERSDPIEFREAPPEVNCCPLREHSSQVDFGDCFSEMWDRFDIEGLPMSKTGISGRKALAGATVAAVFFLGLALVHLCDIHKFSPCAATIGLVLSSSMLVEVLNQVVLAVMPLPATLLALQMFIASGLLLMSHGGISLFRELIEQLPSVGYWVLLAPMSISISLTSIFALQAGSSSLLLTMQNALPLAMLVTEPLVFPRSLGPSPWSLFSLHGVAMVTLFYTWILMRGRLVTEMTPALVVFNGILTMARQLLLRHLSSSKNICLSFGAKALVDNLAGLVIILPFLLQNRDQVLLPRVQMDGWTLACIFFSGCASLCMGYYSNVLQSNVPATAVMVVLSAKKVLMIFLASLFTGWGMTLANMGWSLLSLLGLFGYVMDTRLGHCSARSHKEGSSELKEGKAAFHPSLAAKIKNTKQPWPAQKIKEVF